LEAYLAYARNHLPEIIGFLATLCTISSFLPQALKIKRERDASSVSLRMYAITVTGFSLWTIYGMLLQSLPLIFANAVSLAISLWILLLKLRFSRSG
jgi:MtN3 and saliva related transmembrane protein